MTLLLHSVPSPGVHSKESRIPEQVLAMLPCLGSTGMTAMMTAATRKVAVNLDSEVTQGLHTDKVILSLNHKWHFLSSRCLIQRMECIASWPASVQVSLAPSQYEYAFFLLVRIPTVIQDPISNRVEHISKHEGTELHSCN